MHGLNFIYKFMLKLPLSNSTKKLLFVVNKDTFEHSFNTKHKKRIQTTNSLKKMS